MPPVAKKVLIIDDDRTIHLTLRTLFEKNGYQVIAALDAMQGVMMGRQAKPDLIVLDIMMPAGGGYYVYENLQRMSYSFQVPVIVYTAADLNEVSARLGGINTIRFIQKGAGMESLLKTADELLGGG